MKSTLMKAAAVITLATGIATAQAQEPEQMPIAETYYRTATYDIQLQYRSPLVLNLWKKSATPFRGKPDMVFNNGHEARGAMPGGIHCASRIDFFDETSDTEIAAIRYLNTNPKCGPVEKRADGAIGEFAYYDSNSQLIKQWLYER